MVHKVENLKKKKVIDKKKKKSQKKRKIREKMRRNRQEKIRRKGKVRKQWKTNGNVVKEKGKNIVLEIYKTIKCYFPSLFDDLKEIEDPRTKKGDYEIAELVTACIAMFIFKQGSRNEFNQLREEKNFMENFKRIFKMKLPHMDTVDRVQRIMSPDTLETLKHKLINVLIEKKTLHKYKIMGKWFLVAVDGSGVHSYDEQHCKHCCHKTSKTGKDAIFILTEKAIEKLKDEGVPLEVIEKFEPMQDGEGKSYKEFLIFLEKVIGKNEKEKYEVLFIKHCGKTKWHHHVLEAKLVTSNGFCISLGTEWIENPGGEYTKQDCELKAFLRLAESIKSIYKRLPILVVADGLYSNKTYFEKCREYKWEFMSAFQEGNIPSIWDKIEGSEEKVQTIEEKTDNPKVSRKYFFLNDINYQGKIVHWVKCVETKESTEGERSVVTSFVYLSSIQVSINNVRELVEAGRLRQKIENEGFNTQKNLGYSLEHKYSRCSFQATKNYYQCLQIAHIINQLVEHSSLFAILKQRKTLQFLWVCLIGFLIYDFISLQELNQINGKRIQLRLE
jgi:hypothetical protein